MKKLLLTGTALIAVLTSGQAFAQDNDAMLKQLKTMQAQMESMQREMNKLKEQLAQNKAQTAKVEKVTNEIKAPKAPENDVKISMVPAPKIETADGAYSFKVGGFAQIDAGMFKDDVRDRPDGTNVRRARLNFSGTLAKDFKYKVENDFAGNASTLTDVYLEYAGLKPTSITVGQFKEPFGLETLTSDLFTSFVERASTNLFSPDRKIGVMVNTYGKTAPIGFWTASLGGFGSGTSSTSSTDDEARDITGRITWAPIADKTQVIHFGVAGSHRIPDSSADSFSFSSRAENQMSSSSADLSVNTGTISNVSSVNLLGLEAAGVYKAFSLQGEYVRAAVNRNSGVEPTFGGYYVEASYFLTGESRNYNASTGRFDRVKPMWSLNPTKGDWGSWQIMARYSNLDLNDKTINGGQLRDTTFGIKWLPNSYTMITANYIMSNSDSHAVTPNDDPQIFLLRTQFDF
jgi:phosphate-selective porin OprO/OprP